MLTFSKIHILFSDLVKFKPCREKNNLVKCLIPHIIYIEKFFFIDIKSFKYVGNTLFAQVAFQSGRDVKKHFSGSSN